MIFQADREDEGSRLDRFLASKAPDISRTRLQRFIKEGRVLINGRRVIIPRTRIGASDTVSVDVPEPRPIGITPENISLDIVFEDSHIIVINKPAGMVVHPGAGHETGTLVHALLHHCSDLAGIGDALRPGIVHRLDRDTSGLLVVAKNDKSHESLTRQFAERTTSKRYVAIVAGRPGDMSGTVNTCIGRHPVNRKKMAAGVAGGRDAITHWKLVRALKGACLIEARIVTGRTHQIRVHMASIGHPVAGDTLYGGPRVITVSGRQVVIERQMLHAAELSLHHPDTGKRMTWQAELPGDMQVVLKDLTA